MKKIFMAAMSIFITSHFVFAHGAWIAQRWDQYAIVIGEGWQDNKYDPKQISDFRSFTHDWKNGNAKLQAAKDHANVQFETDCAVISFICDYGYWSKNEEGKWVNAPMNKVKGATTGTHAIKSSVNYVGHADTIKPIERLEYQIVPLTNPSALSAGDTYKVQVLHNGEPIPFVEVIPNVTGYPERTVKADKNGIAVLTAENDGLNVVGVEMTFDYKTKTEKATRDKIFASLSYTIRDKK